MTAIHDWSLYASHIFSSVSFNVPSCRIRNYNQIPTHTIAYSQNHTIYLIFHSFSLYFYLYSTYILLNIADYCKNKEEEKFLTTKIENLLVHLLNDSFKYNKLYELYHNYLKNWTGSNMHNLNLKSMIWILLTPKSLVMWVILKISSTLNITVDEEIYLEHFKFFEKNIL